MGEKTRESKGRLIWAFNDIVEAFVGDFRLTQSYFQQLIDDGVRRLFERSSTPFEIIFKTPSVQYEQLMILNLNHY